MPQCNRPSKSKGRYAQRKTWPRIRQPRVDVSPAGDDQPGEDIGLGQGNVRIVDDRAGDDPARLGGDVARLVDQPPAVRPCAPASRSVRPGAG